MIAIYLFIFRIPNDFPIQRIIFFWFWFEDFLFPRLQPWFHSFWFDIWIWIWIWIFILKKYYSSEKLLIIRCLWNVSQRTLFKFYADHRQLSLTLNNVVVFCVLQNKVMIDDTTISNEWTASALLFKTSWKAGLCRTVT